jgi:phage gp46-like protein
MTDIFSGDPRLFLSENGSRLIFRGGQPVMDRGLENLALISLFTSRGWVGNTLFSDIDQQIGSDFEEAAKQPITLSMLNDVAQAAERALDNPAFGNVTVTIENPNSNRLNVTILIEPPGQDSRALILSRNGDNWIAQKIEPAEGRR